MSSSQLVRLRAQGNSREAPEEDAEELGDTDLDPDLEDSGGLFDFHHPSDFDLAPPVDLDEDVYALAISDMSRDFEKMDKEKLGWSVVYIIRLCTSYGLLLVCIFGQIFLCICVKKYVSRKAVHDIRLAYDDYQVVMYGNDTSNMDITVNGFHRGRPEFFNASLFYLLDEKQKEGACKIPFSEPYFCWCVLWVWTTVCLGKFAKMMKLFVSVIFRTKTCESAAFIFQRAKDQVGEPPLNELTGEPEEPEGKTKIIYQLPLFKKVLFTLLIMLPRALILVCLLWLGCRWLLATNHFSDLLLNAVGLDFILEFPVVFFQAMVPARNKYDLSVTKVLPPFHPIFVDMRMALWVVAFNVLSVGWVCSYMLYFQNVLPDYRWDVHEVCKEWIRVNYAV